MRYFSDLPWQNLQLRISKLTFPPMGNLLESGMMQNRFLVGKPIKVISKLGKLSNWKQQLEEDIHDTRPTLRVVVNGKLFKENDKDTNSSRFDLERGAIEIQRKSWSICKGIFPKHENMSGLFIWHCLGFYCKEIPAAPIPNCHWYLKFGSGSICQYEYEY